MFTDFGEMRICKAKSSPKKLLQVSCSTRKKGDDNATIVIDGSALLWCVQWPEKGTVEDFIKALKTSIRKYLQYGNVNLVFDRYKQYSTKDHARSGRSTGVTGVQYSHKQHICLHGEIF